jgi:hypothetical protein
MDFDDWYYLDSNAAEDANKRVVLMNFHTGPIEVMLRAAYNAGLEEGKKQSVEKKKTPYKTQYNVAL